MSQVSSAARLKPKAGNSIQAFQSGGRDSGTPVLTCLPAGTEAGRWDQTPGLKSKHFKMGFSQPPGQITDPTALILCKEFFRGIKENKRKV